MCGLAGLIDFSRSTSDAVLREEAARMAATLAHRGPDDADVWSDADAGIGFGFQRLSIIDLTNTGKQPMTSACGRWVMMFNGEIYNHKDLRADLEIAGRHFRGTSDTEVLLEAIAHWGLLPALENLNGMFAIALWDRDTRQLHLIRDRLGVKPLYWGKFGQNVIFASELKALRKSDRWTPAFNQRGADAFLKLGYIPAPLSIYDGISKLLPGHGITIAQDGTVDDWSYWSLAETIRAAKQTPIAAEDSHSAFSTCFEDAVRCRASADVPVGAFLSGGIDSTAVVAALCQTGNSGVETFSVGFDEADFDESKHAAAVAQHLGVKHSTIKLSGTDALGFAEQIPEMYDEPFADSSQFPMVAVSKFARCSVTVALSGDGGDELFGGYTRHLWADQTWRQISEKPRILRKGAGQFAGIAPGLFLKLLPTHLRPNAGKDGIKWLSKLLATRDDAELHERIVAIGDPLAPVTASWFADAASVSADLVDRMMYIDTARYLPDDILVKLDRASMAAGLEAREPFLDHNLISLAWSMPINCKIESGQGKRVVREYIRRHVPDTLMDRPKQGFSIPLGTWLRGPLRDFAEAHILGNPKKTAESLGTGHLDALWKAHQSGDADHGAALWAHAVLNAWRQHWRI